MAEMLTTLTLARCAVTQVWHTTWMQQGQIRWEATWRACTGQFCLPLPVTSHHVRHKLPPLWYGSSPHLPWVLLWWWQWCVQWCRWPPTRPSTTWATSYDIPLRSLDLPPPAVVPPAPPPTPPAGMMMLYYNLYPQPPNFWRLGASKVRYNKINADVNFTLPCSTPTRNYALAASLLLKTITTDANTIKR